MRRLPAQVYRSIEKRRREGRVLRPIADLTFAADHIVYFNDDGVVSMRTLRKRSSVEESLAGPNRQRLGNRM